MRPPKCKGIDKIMWKKNLGRILNVDDARMNDNGSKAQDISGWMRLCIEYFEMVEE